LQIAAGRVESMARKFPSAPVVSRWRFEYAGEAIAAAPNKLELHAIRAHALMLLGRDNDARTLFSFSIAGRRLVSKRGRLRSLRSFLEQAQCRAFATVDGRNRKGIRRIWRVGPNHSRKYSIREATNRHFGIRPRFNLPIIHSGEMLEQQGMFDEALAVYRRFLEICKRKDCQDRRWSDQYPGD